MAILDDNRTGIDQVIGGCRSPEGVGGVTWVVFVPFSLCRRPPVFVGGIGNVGSIGRRSGRYIRSEPPAQAQVQLTAQPTSAFAFVPLPRI